MSWLESPRTRAQHLTFLWVSAPKLVRLLFSSSALLFARAQSKQLTKGRFIPFISIPLGFPAGDQSSPLPQGLAEPFAVPLVKAGIACLPPGCRAAAGHSLHRLSWHRKTSLAGENTGGCSCWEKPFCT